MAGFFTSYAAALPTLPPCLPVVQGRKTRDISKASLVKCAKLRKKLVFFANLPRMHNKLHKTRSFVANPSHVQKLRLKLFL